LCDDADKAFELWLLSIIEKTARRSLSRIMLAGGNLFHVRIAGPMSTRRYSSLLRIGKDLYGYPTSGR
jgi:hypothetical protein